MPKAKRFFSVSLNKKRIRFFFIFELSQVLSNRSLRKLGRFSLEKVIQFVCRLLLLLLYLLTFISFRQRNNNKNTSITTTTTLIDLLRRLFLFLQQLRVISSWSMITFVCPSSFHHGNRHLARPSRLWRRKRREKKTKKNVDDDVGGDGSDDH